MRDSADSDDYGVTRRGSKRGQFDHEQTYAKRDRHRRRLQAEDTNDATDGLPEGDRWSTWDQPQNLIPNDAAHLVGMRHDSSLHKVVFSPPSTAKSAPVMFPILGGPPRRLARPRRLGRG
jgi:hypothetical protein